MPYLKRCGHSFSLYGFGEDCREKGFIGASVRVFYISFLMYNEIE